MKKLNEVTLSATCMSCMTRRMFERIQNQPSEVKKAAFTKEMYRIIAESQDEPAPVVMTKIQAAHEVHFGEAIDYAAQKKQYNGLMLSQEDTIREHIRRSGDPFATAMRYARTGNYIDFGALEEVHPEKLQELLLGAPESALDMEEYENLRRELADAQSLVYLTDNCGEVLLDKLFLEVVKEQYPNLRIQVIVRGGDALNDATMEDAEEVGLTKVVPVMGSGSRVAGTYLPDISAEARAALEGADVILSKGQGNFETIHGCGMNIYYIFLCKCPWFEHLFGMRQLEGVFRNERRLERDLPDAE